MTGRGALLHVTDDDPASSFLIMNNASSTGGNSKNGSPDGSRTFGPPTVAQQMGSRIGVRQYVYLEEEDDEGPPLEVLDRTLLDPQEGLSDDVQVMVIRVMFGAVAVQMAFVAIIGLVIWAYGSTLGNYNKGAAVVSMMAILLITLVLLNWLKSSRVALIPMAFFLIELAMVVGFASVALGALAPIQLMVTLFAQSISILGYTAVSPRFIDLKKSTVLLITVTIGCWLIGIFAYVEDKDWVSAVAILILSWLVGMYYVLQIKYSNRYHLNNKIEFISNVYADPIDILWKKTKELAKRCYCCCCCCCNHTPQATDGAVAVQNYPAMI